MTGRFKALLFGMALSLVALIVACDIGGDPPAVTEAPSWPDEWPAPPLPIMSLQHETGPVVGDPHAYCWQFEGAADRVCEEYDIWSGVYEYPQIASHQRIPVIVEAEDTPTRLFAQVYTRQGNLMVGSSRRLSAVNPKLDLALSPGEYNVRLIGYWQDNEVSYEFGLTVPGRAALIGGCDRTDIEAAPILSLKSLDDPMRTAADDANRAGCRFNKPIASVRLTLHSDSLGSYTETFRIDPPSITFPLPLADNVASQKTSGPLPAGEYSRSMVAITEEGEEWVLEAGVLERVIISAP